MKMTSTSNPASASGSSSSGSSSASGIQIGFVLEMIGAAAVIGAAFFSPLPERIAVLSGVGAFAVGRFFPRIVK
jgi:hypothetical protein